MSNYTKSTNFTAKDSLPTGDTNKVVRGSEFDTEFNALSTAVATKADLAGPTFTGTATFANVTATGTINFNGATISNLGTITTANLDGGTIDGAVIGGASAAAGSFTTLSASSTFSLGGVAVTSTAAELNILDGVTSTAAELNILDGVTSTAAELNILDGVTSTAAELNILDGVTSTAAELNILDGVTSTAAELNILDGVTATASELNILSGKSFVDEDDLSSNSATGIPSQQSVKAYVDSQTGLGGATLAGLADTTVTSPADAALLFYDTGTSKWIDNVVSGDVTIADTGVAAIGSGVIVNADVNASAAIDVSKTALVAGTGISLSTNTLNVDAAQTQITSVGTLGSLDVDNIQLDANAVKSTNTNGNIQLFPNGTGFTELYGNTNPGTIRFNCESNFHGVTVKGPAHSAGATYTVNLPDTLGTSAASTLITANASAKVTLTGTTSVAEMIEKVDIPTSTTGTINFDALSQAVQLYNTDQTANRTINFRGDGSTALNAVMAVGESMTSAVLMKQGGSAYYLNAYQVDGSSVTPEWSGGSAPSAGNANSIDAYAFTIIKTADATFTVLASQSQYA